MINLEVLQKQLMERDKRINQLLETINGLQRDYNQYVTEAEQALRSNQDLIFAMFDKFGPKIDIVIPKFTEHMANAQILGGMGIDDDGTLTVNIDFALAGFPETTTPTIDENI